MSDAGASSAAPRAVRQPSEWMKRGTWVGGDVAEALVVGVDGCRGGWVAVATDEGRFVGAGVYADIRELAGAWPQAVVVAIDMPLSFPVSYPRPADVAARRFLKGNSSSLFPVAPEEVLTQATYAEARQKARSILSKSISAQAYWLRKKILEVGNYLKGGHDRRFWEMHPEVSFRLLAQELGRSIDASKKTWNGFQQRWDALSAAGLALPTEPVKGLDKAALDDFLDAAVGAWTAHRIHLGKARSFPEDLGPVKERCPAGRRGTIWA